jgi:hypothetical protein
VPWEARAAGNERILREVNERIRELEENFGADRGYTLRSCASAPTSAVPGQSSRPSRTTRWCGGAQTSFSFFPTT